LLVTRSDETAESVEYRAPLLVRLTVPQLVELAGTPTIVPTADGTVVLALRHVLIKVVETGAALTPPATAVTLTGPVFPVTIRKVATPWRSVTLLDVGITPTPVAVLSDTEMPAMVLCSLLRTVTRTVAPVVPTPGDALTVLAIALTTLVVSVAWNDV